MITVKELIERYNLQAHPEGGHYLQTYYSTETIPADTLPGRFGGDRDGGRVRAGTQSQPGTARARSHADASEHDFRLALRA